MSISIEELTKKFSKFSTHVATVFDLEEGSENKIKDMLNELIIEKKKRAPTAYNVFCSEHRETLKNDGLTGKDITHKLSEMWKELDDSDKEKYKPKKDVKPKRPIGSFLLFCKDERDNVKNMFPDIENTEITKKLGDMWRSQSDEKKEAYKELAKKNMEEFKKHQDVIVLVNDEEEEDEVVEEKKVEKVKEKKVEKVKEKSDKKSKKEKVQKDEDEEVFVSESDIDDKKITDKKSKNKK